MAYVVAHFRKVRNSPGLTAVANHNQRTAVYDSEGRVLATPDYISNPDRAADNLLNPIGDKAVHARRKERIASAQLKRKPQKNAAIAFEAVITASPEWFEGKSIETIRDFFMTSAKYLDDRFGAKNKLHLAVHFDEKTPHLHALYVPIVEGKDGPKYSSSSFLGARDGMRQIQSDIAQAVERFGLERGKDGSKARHGDQYTYARTLEEKEMSVAQRASALMTKADEVKRELEKEQAKVNAFIAALPTADQKKVHDEAQRLMQPR